MGIVLSDDPFSRSVGDTREDGAAEDARRVANFYSALLFEWGERDERGAEGKNGTRSCSSVTRVFTR